MLKETSKAECVRIARKAHRQYLHYRRRHQPFAAAYYLDVCKFWMTSARIKG